MCEVEGLISACSGWTVATMLGVVAVVVVLVASLLGNLTIMRKFTFRTEIVPKGPKPPKEPGNSNTFLIVVLVGLAVALGGVVAVAVG